MHSFYPREKLINKIIIMCKGKQKKYMFKVILIMMPDIVHVCLADKNELCQSSCAWHNS